MRWILRIAVLLLVSGMFVAGPPTSSSSAQATPSLTVTPATGLAGGDLVTVAETGFLPSATAYFCEAVIRDEPEVNDCGAPYRSVPTDATGAFSASLAVFRFITPQNGLDTVDCAQPTAQCVIGASDLSSPNVVTSITFTPQPPAQFAIKGVVTGPGGNAVANAPVRAYTFSDTWIGSLRTVTDAAGTYELDIERGVDYTLRFGPPPGVDLISEWFDDHPNRKTADFVYFSVFPPFNDPVLKADAQLAAGGGVAGTVTDTAGVGVAGTKVWAYGPGDLWVGSFGTTTVADGSYRIDGLRPADYKVRFMPPSAAGLAVEWYDDASTVAAAKRVTVTGGSTATGIDAQLGPSS